jgi:intergrase/recombinase
MNYRPIKTKQTYEDNPFVDKAIEEITIKKKTQMIRSTNSEIQMIVSDEDGDVKGYSAFMRFVEVDEDKFAKIYLSQFESFWELSKPAVRVFGYIINTLKPNSDVFHLRMDKCLKYTKYAHANSVITGLSDLIDKEIIAKSKYENEYFINPLIVFNGSRVTFAKTYVKKQKELSSSGGNTNKIELLSENIGDASLLE